jgi:hypothetical protein
MMPPPLGSKFRFRKPDFVRDEGHILHRLGLEHVNPTWIIISLQDLKWDDLPTE